ncbi:hypothetical protein FGRMN_1502 [Fusarium graminum]|nr:hypothetical protein FGRMN_1502 [Fusarium graminum]
MRGSCTDKNWASPECAMFCLGASTGGTDLISCSNVTNSDTSYCCDHNPNCCNSGVGRFNVLPSNPEIWATWDRKATQYAVVGTVFKDESTSTRTAATTKVIPASTSAISTSETSTAESSTSSSSTPEPSEALTGLSTGAKAGIGAGIGVGAITAGALIYLLWKMRKNGRAAKSEKQAPPVYYEPTTDASWQQSHYTSAPNELQPRPPQELDGHQYQDYNIRAELPAHN